MSTLAKLDVLLTGNASSYNRMMSGAAGTAGKLNGSLNKTTGAASTANGALGRLGAAGQKLGAQLGLPMGKISKTAGLMKSALTGVGEAGAAGFAAVGVAALAAGAFVVGALFKLASGTSKWAAQVRLLKGLTGATAEDASRLVVVLHALGIETATGARGFQLFGKNLEASKSTFTKWFTTAELAKLKTQSLTDSLPLLAKRFQSLSTYQEKSAFLMATFGRGGAALRPILMATGEELKRFGDSARKLGLIFTDKQLAQAREFDISVRELQLSLHAFGIEAGKVAVPIATSLAQFGTNALQSVRDFIQLFNQGIKQDNAAAKEFGGTIEDMIRTVDGGNSVINWWRRNVSGTAEMHKKLEDRQNGAAASTHKLAEAFVSAEAATKVYEDRLKALTPAFGDLVKESKITQNELTKNMTTNISQLKTFVTDLPKIAGRLSSMGVSADVAGPFLEGLRTLGPGAAKLLDQLIATSDVKLKALVELYATQSQLLSDAAMLNLSKINAVDFSGVTGQVAKLAESMGIPTAGAAVLGNALARVNTSDLSKARASLIAVGESLGLPNAKAQELADKLMRLGKTHVAPEVALNDKASGPLSAIRVLIDALHDKTVTINTVRTYTYRGLDPAQNIEGLVTKHGGGPIGSAHNGRRIRSDERLVKAQMGEFMWSRADVRRWGGAANVDALRKGRGPQGTGRSSHGGGDGVAVIVQAGTYVHERDLGQLVQKGLRRVKNRNSKTGTG